MKILVLADFFLLSSLENHATSVLVKQPTVYSGGVREGGGSVAVAVGAGVTCHVSCGMCHVSRDM